MENKHDNPDILHVCAEMAKAINYASQKCPFPTFHLDVQKPLIELNRVIKYYKNFKEEEKEEENNHDM